jgi:hypothetical protein
VATPVAWITAEFAHSVTGTPPPSVYVNATVPLGLVAPVMDGVTVEVKVTDWLTVVVEEEATTLVVVVVSPTG